MTLGFLNDLLHKTGFRLKSGFFLAQQEKLGLGGDDRILGSIRIIYIRLFDLMV